MTQFQKANKVWGWSVKYDFGTMTNRIQTVANCNLEAIRTLYPSFTGDVWSSGFLKEWKVYAEINSLAEAPFPNLSDSLSESERLSAVLNVEWGSPRFHYCVWSTTKNNPSDNPATGDWNLEGKSSLINSFGYPYRIYYPFDMLSNNLAREFPEGFKFGFSIEDVGFGYPQPNDVIVSSGNWTQELVSLVPNPAPINIYVTGGSGGTSTPVTPPTISGAPASETRASSTTALTFNIGALTANTPFTVELIRGTTVVNSSTQTITSGTTSTYSFTPNTYASAGTATYKVKVTQSSLSAETTGFVLRGYDAVVQQSTATISPNTVIAVRVYGLATGTSFSMLWGYVEANGTLTNMYYAQNYTFTPVSGQTYHECLFNSSGFASSAATGYKGPGTYKVRYYSSSPSFEAFSNTITFT